MDINYNDIGRNAGTVWRTLNSSKCSWDELVVATGLQPLELACAVGWLARENKISFSRKDGIMQLDVYHESYY